MFAFKRFTVENERAALKVGTDAVLLGGLMTIPEGVCSALDIGTGTGVVALLAAQRLEPQSGWNIDAIDIDSPSAEEAHDNFKLSPWPEHLRAHSCSLAQWEERACGHNFDLIFSNPPYFESSLRNPDLRDATARHTGNLSYREICAYACTHLSESGTLSIILPSEAEKDLVRVAASFGLYLYRIVRVKTVARKEAKRIVAEFSRKKAELKEYELTLHSDEGRAFLEQYLQHVTL